MSKTLEVKVPDIGDFDEVDVVEVLVEAGARVQTDDSLITLESDKASMEVPSPAAGVVESIAVAVGDQVSEGDLILVLTVEAAEGSDAPETPDAPQSEAPSPSPEPSETPRTVDSALPERDEPGPAAVAGESSYDFDLAVLGSGPGGYAAAFRAADLGLRVVLIERYERIGGVCLNVGCIPSKTLLHVGKVIDDTRALAGHGVTFGDPDIDLEALRAFKEGVVSRLVGGLEQLAKRREVEVIEGFGRFSSPHSFQVEQDGGKSRDVSFARAVIAVGSRPTRLPGLPYDDERVIDSTGALELAEVPDRLLIIGGGIIGLEMAAVYSALGAGVSIVELMPELMPGTDKDLVRPLLRRAQGAYDNVWLSSKVTEVEALENELVVTFEGPNVPESASFDRILVATGRRPNGGAIRAEAAGVSVDERGFIAVDDQLRTNVEHIFAIGDVTGDPMLAHRATHQGKVAAEVAAGLKSGFEARVIPSVAYTDPEVAWVGVTETTAKRDGLDVQKGVFPWAASGRSLSLGRDEGMTKLLFDENGRVVGGGVVGPHAGDLIAEIAQAIEMGADAADLSLTIHPHPTLSETVAMAAEVFEGTITDLYQPKKRREP